MDERVSRKVLTIARALFAYANPPFDAGILMRLNMFADMIRSYQGRVLVRRVVDIIAISKQYSLDQCRFDLVAQLLEQRSQLELFPALVEQFSKLYAEKHRVMQCVIKSSHNLTETQKNVLVRWLELKTGKRVFYSVLTDPALIAGIRIESDSMLWERSIARQLRLLERSL